MSSIADNLAAVRERIARAAARAGRTEAEITLVAVSKRVAWDLVAEALRAGVTDLGESRVQETIERWDRMRGAATVHLIGHLQTNKAGRAVEMYDLIHSVDSIRLAGAIDRRAGAEGKRQDVLIEVNTTGESSKHGVSPDDLESLAETIAGLENLRLRGLMTIGPLGGGADGARASFRALGALRRSVVDVTGDAGAGEVLSMGMSGDFEIAIEEGATHVRVGTAIFGPRDVRAAETSGRSGA